MTVDEKMVSLSVHLIRAGRRSIEEVPEHLQQRVQEELEKFGSPEGE